MTQALDTETQKTTAEAHAPVEREHRGQVAQGAERSIDPFLSELRRMTPRERIEASRYSMTLHERYVYAARYPDEVPTLNGELEWIAATLG
jgi:hypothetical protein